MTIEVAEVFKAGNTAVITGASSGIGRAAALDFAKKGLNVWMVDIDEEELEAAKILADQSKSKADQRIETRVVDVADAKAMESLAEEVFSSRGKCHFLMNNAAISAGGGPFTDIATVNHMMNVNFYGPLHGCLAFVPKMKELGEPGIVVITGSKQGITMPPGNLTYNMTKTAVKCYAEGLEHELRNDKDSKLRAALLIPGWTNTSIMLKTVRKEALKKGEAFDRDSVFFHEDKPANGAWMPQQVIDFMIEELDKGRFYLVCPDNEVDRETDNARMTWTMGDITENRPPLSRWHDDYKDKFTVFLEERKQSKK